MYGSKSVSLSAQRGVSVTGLIVVLAIIGMVAMLALKVFPFILEYQAAKAAIVTAKTTDGGVLQQRMAFNRAADMNSISTITHKDLIFYKVNGQNEVAFDYEAKAELFTNVSLVIRFAHTTDPSGVIPPKKSPEEMLRQ
jgi:hypothetical protein